MSLRRNYETNSYSRAHVLKGRLESEEVPPLKHPLRKNNQLNKVELHRRVIESSAIHIEI